MGLVCPSCGERNAEYNPRCRSCDVELPEVSSVAPGPGSARQEGLQQAGLLPGSQVSHYQVQEKLGSGGMGQVYRALDLRLRRSVALKFLSPRLAQSPQARSRFLREAQAASTLDHPNIGTIYEIGEDEAVLPGQMFIAMALYEGQTLAERIAAGPLELEEAAGILAQVAAGLDAAHAAGIVHRDLKPANVMLIGAAGPGRPASKPPAGGGDGGGPTAPLADSGGAGRTTPLPAAGSAGVKILDFGLAKLLSEAEDSGTALTESGKLLGTVAYMSPEQARGDVLDPRTDLWSLGVVAYEMLAGRRPFQADNKVAILSRILTEEPPPLETLRPDAPEPLLELIRSLLCKQVEGRKPSATEVLRDLGVDPDSSKSPPGGLRRQTPWGLRRAKPAPKGRRHRAAAAGLGLALLLGLAGGLRYHATRGPDDAQLLPLSGQPTRPVALRRSVAVLGFRNLAASAEKAWLSTALSEMLRTELAAGDKLRVIPGESVARMLLDLPLTEADGFGQETLGRIRENLGTDLVVVGSYLALSNESGGRIRLDLRLQDAAAGETLAAVSQTGSERELFELVSRTGAVLRQELKVGPRSAQEAEWVRTALPSEPEAARFYAEGLGKMRIFEAVEARELLEKAVAIEPGFPLAHTALAEALRYLGDTEKGRNEARRAWELAGALPKQEQLVAEGSYRLMNQERDKALEIYRTLFDYYPDNPEYGLLLAEAQNSVGRPKDALETLAALRKLPPPASDDLRIDGWEARVALALNDTDRALEVARREREKAQERGARVFIADALFIEAVALAQSAEHDLAIAAAAEAQQLFAGLGDLDGVAQQLRNISMMRLSRGEMPAALETARQALEVRRQIGDRSQIATAMIWLGTLLRERGELSEADRHYTEALELLDQAQDQFGQAKALIEMAWLLQAQGDVAGARQTLDRSAALHDSVKSPRLDIWPKLLPIVLALDEERHAEAECLALEALEAARERKKPALEAVARDLLAQALLEQGRLSEAREAFETAPKLAERNKDSSHRLYVAITGARLRAADAGAREAAEALRVLESVISEARRSELLEVELRARLAAGELELRSEAVAAGQARLAALEAEARAKGYNGIARKAKGE